MAYLLFFPMAILLSLMVYVYAQGPRRWLNRLFSLYMLNLTLATYAVLVVSTAQDPNIANVAMLVFIATNWALGSFFLVPIILSRFFPRALVHWYGWPLFLGVSGLLLAGLLVDGVLQTGTFYTPSPGFGLGYVNPRAVMTGFGGAVLRAWFMVSNTTAIACLILAWIRNRPGERAPSAILVLVLIAAGISSVALPESPVTAIVPATIFAFAFSLVILRYRLLVSAQVALEAVFGSTAEGMVICSSEGAVERVNAAAETLTAAPRNQVLGQPFTEAFAQLLRETHQEANGLPLEEAFHGQETFRVLLRPQNEGRPLLVAGMPIRDESSRVVGRLVLLQDVTEQEHVKSLLAAEQEQRERLQEITASLRQILKHVRETAADLFSGAAEILAATIQQAAGASEQNAAISQTSATIDQVRAIAEQTVQRAQGVAGLAEQAATVSQDGRRAVATSIVGMQDVKEKVATIATDVLALSEQAESIQRIIATVNEIAAQSNMLALNAAIEAARAGEAGKGFAVVAGEVRSLAEQSRAATVQVKDILGEVQRAVNAAVMTTEEGIKGADEGVNLITEANRAIQMLAESVREAAQAAAQIAAAAEQQLAGMEQITLAIQNIHEATTQNLAGTHESEQAAAGFHDLARQLHELVREHEEAATT